MMKMKYLLIPVLILLALTACSVTGEVVLECTNGTAIGRLCGADACTSDHMDYACCENSVQWCAYEGECYEHNVLWKTEPNYYPKGMFCFRLIQGFETTVLPRWYDCDDAEGAYCSNRSYCNFRAARSGEEEVGEYERVGKRECCGDDNNEYYISGVDGTNACCKKEDRTVEEGICVLPVELVVQEPVESEVKSQKSEDTEDYEVVLGDSKEEMEIDYIELDQPERLGFFQKIVNWFKELFS